METIVTDIPQDVAKETAADLKAFLDAAGAPECTRLIGITKAEHEALKRGATLILGQPREGMQPIGAGQELLAIVGYVPGDAPRMDAERMRLRVAGFPELTSALTLNTGYIARITGKPEQTDYQVAAIDLTAYLQAVCAEIKSFDPMTPKIAIPVEVIP
jgi:hypothetical protein